jgi:hypothetical protein
MTDHDESVDEATIFDPTDAPLTDRLDGIESQRQHYQRLSVANSLNHNGKWRDENKQTEMNSQAIVDAVASQLELTDYQTERAKHFFDQLPDRFNQGYSTSLLALCVVGFAGREDGRRYHPSLISPSSVREPHKPSPFRDLAIRLDISYSELYKCWHKVGRELDN